MSTSDCQCSSGILVLKMLSTSVMISSFSM